MAAAPLPPRSLPRSPQLPHFTGARAFAALWIVCHHTAPRKPSVLDGFVVRVDVAVEYFTLLSGFLTQHAHGLGPDPAASAGSLARFYVRRLSRLLLTAQVATAASMLLRRAAGTNVATLEVLGCFFFVKGWAKPAPSCPDMPTWYVDAIVPCWLLYPVLTRRLLANAATQPHRCFALLGAALWLLAIGPGLVAMAASGRWLRWHEVVLFWFWPPTQLADFALGALVAAALQGRAGAGAVGAAAGSGRAADSRGCGAGAAADSAIAALLLASALLPVPEVPTDWDGPPAWRPGHYVSWEAFTGRLAAPLLATFLYCSGDGGGGSRVAAFLAHPVLVALGSCTLEVYLFQAPLRDLLLWLAPPAPPPLQHLWPGLHWSGEVFLAYVVVLWGLAALFAQLVAEPLQRRLQAATEHWEGMPLGWFFGRAGRGLSGWSELEVCSREQTSESDSSLA